MSKAGIGFWPLYIGLFVLMVVHQGWKQALIVGGVIMAFSVTITITVIVRRGVVKRSRNEDPVNRRADLFDF